MEDLSVEILDVQRKDGRAAKVVARVGDIRLGFVSVNGSILEEFRFRDIQVSDRDTLSLPPVDFRELQRKIRAIFSEDRSSKA